MSYIAARRLVCLALFLAALTFSLPAFTQNATFFTQGNLVVAVEGCGVHAGTCTGIPNGTGTGSGNSSNGGYGDNQASPLTLFQYSPNGTSSVSFVNSLALPQSASLANVAVSGEYGSSSEASVNLAGTGQYLTLMGYGIDDLSFNASPTTYGSAGALAQSGSLTGQSYTAVPRVVALIDANGNINTATAVYNVFNTNNPRSSFTQNGTTAYISGQGEDGDATQGVFYLPSIGVTNNAPMAITGLDATDASLNPISQDTRNLQIINNTLYVSVDTKGGKNSARSFIGTLGTPPATSFFAGGAGPTQLNGFGTSKTGKLTITTGANSNGNNLNAGLKINFSPVNYFFASPSVLYVADSGFPKNDSNGDNDSNGKTSIGNGGLEKWINTASDGSGTWNLAYTLYQGLNIVNNGGTSGTTGLFGLAGVVSGNNVLLYATNYTIGDLDQTYLYGITDNITFTTATQASGETFTQLEAAPQDSNFKGISFAPTIPAGDVEVTSVPSGVNITASGTGCAPAAYNTPQTLTWTPGSSCTLTAPASIPVSAGVQWGFEQWEDATTNASHIVTAPSTTATYTATYTTDYQLTTSAGSGGTVSAGGFFAAGSSAQITATPTPGFYFVNFTGATTSTNNPLSLLMNSPQSITANFAAITQTTTSVMSSLNPSSYGQAVSFAALVTGSNPTGTVQFLIDSSAFGPPVSLVSGSATSSTISNLTAGTHVVVAIYSGDTANSGSSGGLNQAVNSANSIVSVASSLNRSTVGQSVTFTATINGENGLIRRKGSATPDVGGTVTWSDNTGCGTTSVTSGNPGTATCTTTILPIGASDSITASYSGDSNHAAGSGSINQEVDALSVTVSVASNKNPSTFGQSVTFTANLSSSGSPVTRRKSPQTPDVTGTVTWSDNTGCGTVPVSAGAATCTTSSLGGGTDTITATYSGDGTHAGASGTLSGGQVVKPATQFITITVPLPVSEPYNGSFTVTANASSGLPLTYASGGGCTNSGATYTMTSSTAACFVTLTQPGNANYSAAPQQSRSVNATLAPQTITLSTAPPTTAVYGTSFTIAASASSGLSVAYTSAGSCSNSGTTYTITAGTGKCSVILNQSGDSNYSPATQVTKLVTATKARQVVSFAGAPPTALYQSTFTLLASSSDPSSVATITSSNPTTCGLSGPNSPVTVTMLKGMGVCKFTATFPTDGNYLVATASQTTTAQKPATQLSWATPAPIVYGTPLGPDQLNATANVLGNFVYSPVAGTVESVGSKTLKVTFTPTDPNDSTATTTVTLQVSQAPTSTTITSSSATVTLNASGIATSTITFNVTSYKPMGAVTITASTGEVCSGAVGAATGNGNCRLTFTTPGTRTISASYAGDSNHTGSDNSGQTPAVTVTVNPH